MPISQGKDLILNFKQFYFFTVIYCIAQFSIKLSALVVCCFKMCADFFLNTEFSVLFLKTLYLGPIWNQVDPESRPLQTSSSKEERFEHTEVGQSFKADMGPYLKAEDLVCQVWAQNMTIFNLNPCRV